jgi:hypothetical protein
MARRSQWRLWTLSATLIVLLRAGWIAVMTVVLQNGSARQLTPCELAELNGEAPAHSGRQSRPGHDRCRKSLLHGASRPSGSTPATRRGRAAASPPTGVPLQTFQRGWFENHIKAWKNHLAADRTSCHAAEANQFRLFLHAGAYWLLWSMRRLMPPRSAWRVMQFDTLRLRLLKLAARVVELKKQVKIHLPSSAPDQAIFAMLLDRLPRLVT